MTGERRQQRTSNEAIGAAPETAEPLADADPRLTQIVELLVQFASGNLKAEAKPSGRGDELDAVIVGITLLGQELASTFDALRARTEDLERANAKLAVELEAHRRTQERLEIAQEQFIQAQKMEIIGRLAGGVAHDFNNVLCAVIAYAGFVKRRLEPGSPADADIDQVLHAAERAAGLTRQLLAFSRRQVLHPRVTDLNELFRGTSTMLRRLLGENTGLVLVTPPGAVPTSGDPGQLEQVLLNLVVNARDASPSGGSIVVETANVTVDEELAARFPGAVPGPHAAFSVADHGVGMTEEVKRHLFEPFFTTKGMGKGTGLGLAVVYGVITQHRGFIDVDSRPGEGSTFRVYLPRATGPVDARSTTPCDRLPRGEETILLAEDDGAVRSSMMRTLRSLGYEVIEAATGQEALTQAAKVKADVRLLISDMAMPGMGGRELAVRLKQERPQVNVLFVSGHAGVAEDEGIPAGAEFLQKPFTSDMLARRVREVLDRQR